MEEYRAISSEISLRLTLQSQLLSYAIALIGGIGALSQFVPNLTAEIPNNPILRSSLLVIAGVFGTLCLMYVEHDIFMGFFGKYVSLVLRPRMIQILMNVGNSRIDVWQWQSYRMQSMFVGPESLYNTFNSASRYSILFLPAILSFIAYISITTQQPVYLSEVPWWDWLLLILDLSLMSAFILQGRYGYKIYNSQTMLELSALTTKERSSLVPIVLWCLLLGIIWAYVVMGSAISLRWPTSFEFGNVDFFTYYAGGVLFANGENIYSTQLTSRLLLSQGLPYIFDSNYIYPPYLAGLLSIFRAVPPGTLAFVWYLLSLMSLSTSVWFMVEIFWKPDNRVNRLGVWRNALIGSLLFLPTIYSFFVGQINAFILLLITLAFYFAKHLKKSNQAGIAISLALAAVTKVAPAILVLFFLARRFHKAIIFMSFCIALIAIVTAQIFANNFHVYFTAVLPYISRLESHPVNQSLNGFFSRLLVSSEYTMPWLDNPQFARILILLMTLALIMVCLYYSWNVYRAQTVGDEASAAFYSMLIIVMVVVSPLAWENLYILLLFPVLFTARHWRSLSRSNKVIFVLALGLMTVQRLWDPFVNAPRSYPILRGLPLLMSLGLYGALIMLWLQVRLLERFLSNNNPQDDT